jgi:hypothetical protein
VCTTNHDYLTGTTIKTGTVDISLADYSITASIISQAFYDLHSLSLIQHKLIILHHYISFQNLFSLRYNTLNHHLPNHYYYHFIFTALGHSLQQRICTSQCDRMKLEKLWLWASRKWILWSLVDRYQHLRGTYLPKYMASYPRKPHP